MADVTCVLDSKNALGEGPVWDHAEHALYWLDIPRPTTSVNRYHPASGKHTVWHLTEIATALAVREKGGLLLACLSGINFFDPHTGKLTHVVKPDADKPRNRPNDGKCDRKGRFWIGTMQNNLDSEGRDIPITDKHAGSLFRIDPDGTCTKMASGFGISNTLAWSMDNTIMYFGDSFAGIYAFDFDLEAGTISNQRPLYMTSGHDVPDGSTIDSDGYLWNARWDGGCLLRIAPDGTVERTIKMPISRPTSCSFGGDDLDILYVTSARQGLSEAQLAKEPQAGSIFAVTDLGARGVPEPRFAG